MSIQDAMSSGVSGLDAETQALNVIGNNVSNVSTTGYKEQRADFENILGQSISNSNGSSSSVGAGVQISGVDTMYTQGTLTNTGVSTDMAITGNGFFMVNGNVGGLPGTYYTRDGQFSINAKGAIVNENGLNVQGYEALGNGTFSAAVGNLTVGTSALPPNATTQITLAANLNSASTIPTAAWDPQNPSATSNFSTSVTTYDSLGNAHQLQVYFRETAANTWDYHVLANGAEVTGGTPGQNVEVGTGTLAFTTGGALQTITTTTPIVANFVGATAGQAITLNFGSQTSGGGTGLDGVTQFAAPSNVETQSQDGYASGQLAGVNVDQNGVITGTYSNGQQLAIGQLAIATFQSNQGLAQTGQNLLAQTNASGLAAVGTAAAGGRGSITGGSLEQSNVDLASQMVDMITHERAFQSDSKTIQTADQMLQVITQLKQ
jgi:flagellar hook protein FlgE